jgi:hypothetical protein
MPAAQRLERVPEVARRLCPELEPSPRRGVDETEQRGVQRQPPGYDRVGRRIAVDRVPQHGVAQVGEVDPHLVRSPGSELRLDQSHPSESFERAHHGVGRSPSRSWRQSRPACARAWAADAASDQHFACHVPAHERNVAALDGVGAELRLKVVGRGVGEGEHHHTRGITVESVDDQHPSVAAAPPLELGRDAGQHRVLVPLGRRVNEKSRGFVHDHEIRVRVKNFDRGCLGRACTPREVGVVFDRVAGSHFRTGVRDHHAVDQHVAEKHLALRTGVGRGQDGLGRAPEPVRVGLHRTSVSPR